MISLVSKKLGEMKVVVEVKISYVVNSCEINKADLELKIGVFISIRFFLP